MHGSPIGRSSAASAAMRLPLARRGRGRGGVDLFDVRFQSCHSNSKFFPKTARDADDGTRSMKSMKSMI
jgi:hypothetical protein